MKIIEQSQEILKSTDLVKQIESAGRLAYKSEDKIADDTAENFVSGIIRRGHWPVLDMGCVNMQIVMGATTFANFMNIIDWGTEKYLFFDMIGIGERPGDKLCLFSGSPRALTEFLNMYKDYNLMAYIAAKLQGHNPVCFAGLKRAYEGHSNPMEVLFINIDDYTDYVDADVYKRHKHIGVKFITNRAVTHELVRHRPCGFIQESQRYCRYDLGKFGSEVTFIKPMFYKEGTKEYDQWEWMMTYTEDIYLNLLKTSSPQAARTVLPNSCKTEIIIFCNLMQWQHIFRLRSEKNQGAEPSMREAMEPVCQDMLKMFPMIDIETPAYE